jgi:hypothetical protein
MTPTLVALGALAGTCFSAPTPIDAPVKVIDPTSIAPLYLIDGQIIAGDEIPYNAPSPQVAGFRTAFDQLMLDPWGHLGNSDALCGPGGGFFSLGANARSPHIVNDFSGMPPQVVGHQVGTLSFAWIHNPVTPEPMRVAIFWWSEFSADCAGFPPSTDSIVAARGFITGVVLTFSGGAPVAGSPSSIFTNPDVSALNLTPFPSTSGAYEIMFIQLLDGDPNTPGNQPVFASRSQPLLTGTQRDANPPPAPYPDNPGGPGLIPQWDDGGGPSGARPTDGLFTAAECDQFNADLCYRPLGAAILWSVEDDNITPPFALLSPAPNTRDRSLTPTLSWDAAIPAPESYTVVISRQPMLSSPVFTARGITSTSFQLPPGALSPCEQYYWGVYATLPGGGTVGGSPKSFGYATTSPHSPDFNNDGQVDFFDYLDFAQAFNDESPSADFNGDTQIDFFDYLDFAEAFDYGC